MGIWTHVKGRGSRHIVTFCIVYLILFYPFDPPSRSDSLNTEKGSDDLFQHLMSGPLQFADGQIKGAAMMLVSKPWTIRRGERQCFFNKSMDLLKAHWHDTNPYPIILQHPDGWAEAEMKDILDRWPLLPIFFSKLGSAFHVDPPEKMEDEEKPLSPLGYKKMCRFKTFGFLDAPYIKTKELDYMLYLDDDSCLTEPIQFDIFQKMRQNNIAYTYKQLFLDRGYVVRGLTEFVKNYVQSNNLQYANAALATWLKENGFQQQNDGSHWTFSTNFEVVDLKQFRRRDIVAFHQEIDKSGMIFHRRWGDAPLRFVLAYLFWNRTQVMRLCSEYVHSMWESSPSTCADEQQSPFIDDAVLHHLQTCESKATCN